MLSIRPSRILIQRGIATSATKKDLYYFPAAPSKNQCNQIAYVDHPNRNLEYFEDGYKTIFPMSPRFADKDVELNELRAKATGDWSAMTTQEARKIYDGHFRNALHVALVPDDIWKMWFGMWAGQLFIFCTFGLFWNEVMQTEQPEYQFSEHFTTERCKQRLQENLSPFWGMANHFNYVDSEWKDKHWQDRAFGLYQHFLYFNRHPTEGDQLGFTYLRK